MAAPSDSQQQNALTGEELSARRDMVPKWEIRSREGMSQLERTFSFEDFAGALAFTDAVGALAEKMDHHPRIVTEWGSVTVTWWSHDAGGLTKRDFRAAAMTDACYEDGGEG